MNDKVKIQDNLKGFEPDKNNSIRARLKLEALKELSAKKLPDDVSLSTMTLVCNIGTKINAGNIARYIDLSVNSIISVSHGRAGDVITNRSITKPVRAPKKTKKQKKMFYNQVSIQVRIKSKLKPVNVKLFSNGSIQMTGCKNLDHALDALEMIFIEMKKVKAVLNIKAKKVIEKPFLEDLKFGSLEYVKGFKVVMINSNFKMPFKIDRYKLYNLLVDGDYDCVFDPDVHACVNIKYSDPGKTISIFVFEKGSIIITGAKNCEQIKNAYDFINVYLLKNHDAIVKHDVSSTDNIMKYITETQKNNPRKKNDNNMVYD